MAGPDSTTMKSTILQFLPVGLILVPLGVHFLLVGFVLIFAWLPMTYIYSHLIFSAVGLWAAYDQKRILPVVVFLVVLVVTVLLDCVQLGVRFPVAPMQNRTWQFSVVMLFFNLLLKPVTGILAGIAIYLRSRSLGSVRGNSSEEAPQTGSVYATSGSHVQPSEEYPSPYVKPVATPVGPVDIGPTDSMPHYEYESQH